MFKKIESDNINSSGNLAFYIRTIDSCGDTLFEYKLSVTWVWIPLGYSLQSVSQLETIIGLCHFKSLDIDPQQ